VVVIRERGGQTLPAVFKTKGGERAIALRVVTN
jgi:hypothetical protein